MLPSDRSVHACAIREVREETGLSVQVGKLVYVREFVEVHSSLRHLELFFLADEVSGELTLANIAGSGPDEDLIKDVRWLSRTELLDLVVYPELLKHKFWEDWSAGFPEACYLGVSTGE
jgi:ADP-ribose pyrophosphatase YjhB (NUDIX family)